MRLLLVNYEYPPVGAGAATATQAIARKLVALGHEVTVLTGRYRDLPRESNEAGVTVRRILCLRRNADRSNVFEMFGFTLSSLLALPSVRARYRPEALIVFFSLPSGPIGAAAHFFYQIPYLVSLRGGDVPGLTPEVNWIHKLFSPLRRLILRNAVAVIANSEGLRKLSEAADPIRVQVIPNGVDTEFFQPALPEAETPSQSRPLRILFVGRFQGQKNLPCLIEQCAHLPAGSFELHLVGDGPLHAELRTLADQLGIAAAITWHGWLPRPGLRDVYRSADCFVNPSLYEGLPNAVLEAMASGLAVIASRVPGNEELVTPGETGLLFDLDDPPQLAGHLRTLANDVGLSQRMGQAGRRVAERRYSWRNVAECYLELLKQPLPHALS
jgi:glycosyltransferase involved in cell wall biosynthesis